MSVGIDPVTGCPENYESLYAHYFTMIKSIVLRAGINENDVEDVAMELLAKFIEKGGLSWYDPNLLHDVGENPRFPGPRYRPAKFQGLLRGFCRAWVRQYLDKQATRFRREAVLEFTGENGSAIERVLPPAPCEGQEAVEVYDALSLARKLRDRRVDAALRSWTQRQSDVREESTEGKDRQQRLWQARQDAQQAIEDACLREKALVAATGIAMKGERVTGTSVAKVYGWPPSVGVSALRGAREDLRAVGL